MTLFRNDQQTLLNELGIAAQTRARDLRDAAKRTDDKAEARLFQNAARRSDAIADKFAFFLRQQGDMPGTPDTDKDDLIHFFQRLRSALTADSHDTLIEQQLQRENRLIEILSETAQKTLPGEWKNAVDDFRRHVEEFRAQLFERRSGKQ